MFFFQAEDGIRDLVRSRGLGDVYKRQAPDHVGWLDRPLEVTAGLGAQVGDLVGIDARLALSLIHI